MRMAKAISVLKAIATTRATYRFLGLLLVGFGVTQGDSIGSFLETTTCLWLGGCNS